MLWSATVTKDSPAQLELPFDVRITKACLGGKVVPNKRYMLQATYEDPFEGGEPAMATLCSLSEGCENVDLDLVIDAHEAVVLATGGTATIYLSGYMIMPDIDLEGSDSDDSDDEDGVRYVLDALSRAESDSDDSDSDDEEGEPKVREITSSDEEDSDDESESADGDVDMDEEESSGESVQVFEENEDTISDSILKKIQEKAARIQAEQKKASSPAVGKKRRASSEPTEVAPANQKKQRVDTPAKKAASPASKAASSAASPAAKTATHRNQEEKKNKSPLRRTLPGGLVIETVKQGNGKAAQKGKQVTVKYTGKLANGKKFDSGTFSFRVGTRQVIQGWDMGVPGMKVGEQRKLIIPPKLAYGKKGAGRDIPPNSTLHFDVELLKC